MKILIAKCLVLVFAVVALATNANAQGGRKPRKRTTTDTTSVQKPVQVQQNNNQAVKYNPFGNSKIVTAPVTGGFNDTVKPSLRNDAAYNKNTIRERTPLPYEDLRMDDALMTERVWREIDIREKINQSFRYKAEDDNGDQRFVSILVKAIRDSLVTAFSPDDDRFTTPLSIADFNKSLNGGNQCDTLPVYNLNDPTKIDSFVITCNTTNPDDIVKFRIKEDWVFDRESSRLFVRILGIAPMKTIFSADKQTERGATPLFWVYYPDMRSILAKYEVYNSKNMGMGRMTWEELFESRMFGSYVVKSTLDNPTNKFIRQYIKDPILQLLEGDNIREKIFNYEQDLWSY